MAMDFGVCRLTMVPVFEKPDYHSIQCNQLLFGEAYEVTGEKGGWLSILTTFDTEGGWIHISQHHSITKDYFDQINTSDYKITTDISATLLYNKTPLTIVMGSIVPISNSELFKVEEQLAFNGETKSMSQKRDAEFLKAVLTKFINAPFAPGGKTPFGTDAMGFIQIAFKIAGYKLPRTIDALTRQGTKVDWFESAVSGDILILKSTQTNALLPAVLTAPDKAVMIDGFVQQWKVDASGIKIGAQKKYSWEMVEIRRVI
jgi:gamma-D-glutamyl-L-lysine dipeptidyl-peptidase